MSLPVNRTPFNIRKLAKNGARISEAIYE